MVTCLQELLFNRSRRDQTWLVFPKDPISGSEAFRLKYSEIQEQAVAFAVDLNRRGAKPKQNIGIIFENKPAPCAAVFGVLAAGMIPVPLPTPSMTKTDQYVGHLRRISIDCKLRAIYTVPDIVPVIKDMSGLPEVLSTDIPTYDIKGTSIHQPIFSRAEDIALIQYTSGSTQKPRGAMLTHKAILSNIKAIGQEVRIDRFDVVGSWLPLFHDMGLIGTLFVSLYWALPLVLLNPRSFVRKPYKWLWAISRFGATLSPAPNFAYRMCASLPSDDVFRGLDLSKWRVAITGSEQIHPSTVDSFCKRFAPYGFDSNSILPAYGLAENALCVTLCPSRKLKQERIDRDTLEHKNLARVAAAGNGRNVVSVGHPVSGQEVRIADENDHPLSDRLVGEIQVSGPSVMKGYFGDKKANQKVFSRDGWLKTGDRGYLAKEELFILGRSKEIIKKAGTNLDAADIEHAVRTADGDSFGHIVAFGVPNIDKGTEDLIILIETANSNSAELTRLRAAVSGIVGSSCRARPDEIHFFRLGTIPKTTSGKSRVEYAKQRFLQGAFSNRELSASY